MRHTHSGNARPAAFFPLNDSNSLFNPTHDDDGASALSSYLPVGLRPSFVLGLFFGRVMGIVHP